MEPQTDGTMAQHLVVARDRPDLWAYWKKWFARVEDVRVILDRRRGERRRPVQGHEPERRRADRRTHQGMDDELRSTGFSIVSP